MVVLIKLFVIGLVKGNWTDKDGMEHEIFKVNYSQNAGQQVGQLSVSEEVFNALLTNKEFILEGIYTSGKNGNYLRITGIYNNGKGEQA